MTYTLHYTKLINDQPTNHKEEGLTQEEAYRKAEQLDFYLEILEMTTGRIPTKEDTSYYGIYIEECH